MSIVVNVSKKESEAQSFDLLPNGKYHVAISGCELQESNSAKNRGKPMYNIEFTIQTTGNETHDAYEGRKVWTIACLWDGALYTIINIMKALGYDVDEGQLEIPDPDEFLGRELIVKVSTANERTVTDENTGEKKTYDKRNEVKGFFALGATEVKVPKVVAGVGSASSGGKSILP